LFRIFQAQGEVEQAFIETFLSQLTKKSPFFLWMRSNFADFVQKDEHKTQVNYALADKFVSFVLPSVAQKMIMTHLMRLFLNSNGF
jgi:hypothetical protein